MEASVGPARAESRAATRPLGSAVAVSLLGLIGFAGLLLGPYLIVLGAWLSDRAGDATPLVVATETILGVGCIGVGLAAIVAARGLWQAKGWAWPIALTIGLVLLVGMAVIWLLETWLAVYGLVVLVGGLLVLSLLPAGVRREFGL